MLIEVTRLSGGLPVADVCVVGSGPAGLALAEALGQTGRSVLVLESGGLLPDAFAQSLNQGTVAGAPYSGLANTRFRQVGGTAKVWNTPVAGQAGAKYVPLDPGDFAPSSGAPWSGWPFGLAELTPYYERAQQVCGLGPFRYEAAHWASADRPLLATGSGPLYSGIYQFGTSRALIDRITGLLEARDNVLLCPGATVVALTPRADGSGVAAVAVAAPDGGRAEIPARQVVLAGGAVENARLLLFHRAHFPRMDQGDWLGRCFMEHPRDYSLSLELPSPDAVASLRFYDLHQAADGSFIAGRLGVESEALGAADLPAAAITLLPEWRPAGRGLWSRLLGRTPAIPASGRYGWSQTSGAVGDRCRLVVNLEQRPRRLNRIVLEDARDPLGVPRPRLELTWSPEEQHALDALRRRLADWFGQIGLGRLAYRPGVMPDLNAHHHAGTTRMHEDPRGGVVDPDLRVHGVDNLFAAGGSVFPSAGWANPVLTIVALSLRLSDHLQRVV